MGSANERQVGGDHYKVGEEQHWDRVARLGLDYYQGQVTKYVERWKKKGGVQDLKKAQHFLEKYVELAEAGKLSDWKPLVSVTPVLGPGPVVKVTLNGKVMHLNTAPGPMSYEEIVRLAQMSGNPSMAWSEPGGPKGILSPGRTLLLTEGLNIDCVHTNNA